MLRAVASQPASGTGVAGVSSFNGRAGAVVLGTTDITSAGGAPLNNANLTGVPTVPTAGTGTATTQAASTAFVANNYLSLAGANNYLPLTGGTMTGPLNLTATSGTVVRSEQTRWADIANVLDFGADPTNTNDSTSAFLAAIATKRAVYIPTGQYIITNILTLNPAQSMYGDGRNASIINVYGAGGGKTLTFTLTAAAVIQLSSVANNPDGGVLRDFGISFYQGDTSVRANIVQFPYALDVSPASRCFLYRLRISMANLGIKLGAGVFLNDCEMSAFTTGLSIDGAADVAHIKGFHFWNFGFSSATYPGLSSVFQDGTTTAFSVGRADGMIVVDFFAIFGNIVFTTTNTTWSAWTNVLLDNYARMICNGSGTVQIGTMVLNLLGTTTINNVSGLQVNFGTVLIDDFYFSFGSHQTVPGIQVSGTAELAINGCAMTSSNAGVTVVQGGGGHLRLKNIRFYAPGTITAPFIAHTSGDIVVSSCDFGANATSGVGVSIGVDSLGNRVANNNMGGFTYSLPSAYPPLGSYIDSRGSGCTFSTPTMIFGIGTGQANLVINGGGGGDRTIRSQSVGVTDWAYGEANTRDWIVNRWVSGASVDNPIVVRNATGVIELGNASANDVVTGYQAGLATGAVTGFLYIPNMVGGSPTATPTNAAKGAAVCFDRANNTLWAWNTNTNSWQGTAFAGGGVSGVSSFNTRTGAVTLQAADVTGVGGALLASPIFTGTPTAPTPVSTDNSTTVATTAYVQNITGNYLPLTGGTITSDLTVNGSIKVGYTTTAGFPTPSASTQGSINGYMIGLFTTGFINFNAYYGASSFNYYASGTGAAQLSHNNGTLSFSATTTTGAAGSAVTFNPTMTLGPTGNLSLSGSLSAVGGTLSGNLTVTTGGLTVSAGGMNVTGASTFANGLTIGSNTASATSYVQGQASSARDIHWQTAGSDRWVLSTVNTETGTGNAGADLRLTSYSDAASALWNALTITRANGLVTCGNNFTVGGGLVNMGGTSGASTFTMNGGGGAARVFLLQAGSVTEWAMGTTTAHDWNLNRYVSGTATDSPFMVRFTTGQVEVGAAGTADILMGKQTAKALTDTAGYMTIPWCQGTPTGIPANASHGPCFVFDVTGFKLWVYTGSAWKGVVVS